MSLLNPNELRFSIAMSTMPVRAMSRVVLINEGSGGEEKVQQRVDWRALRHVKEEHVEARSDPGKRLVITNQVVNPRSGIGSSSNPEITGKDLTNMEKESLAKGSRLAMGRELLRDSLRKVVSGPTQF